MYVCYNNNTHAVLEVDASLESPMQGRLHSESLWMGMLCEATSPFDTQAHTYLQVYVGTRKICTDVLKVT